MSKVFPNPPVAVDALLVPMTSAIVLKTMIDELVTLGIRADLWPTEGVLISCMTVVANAVSGFINDRITATKAGWLPTSSGDWLTWLALYMYGVIKVGATFASGPIVLTNNGGGSYSFAPFTASFQDTVTKATYKNFDAISLSPGPGTTQTINVQADVAGAASNSAPGDLTTILTTMLGVTCTNLVPVLGSDAQSDDFIRLECWNAIAANSPYNATQALAYAVQTAVNSVSGLPVNINRWTISPSSHTGMVQVYVASPTGAPFSTDVTGVATKIAAIATPPSVVITTTACSPVSDTDALIVYVAGTPGLDAATVQLAIENALDDFFAAYPIGGRTAGAFTGLFATAVDGVCFGAWPGVYDVQGAKDLALLGNQVATNSTTVTVRIT